MKKKILFIVAFLGIFVFSSCEDKNRLAEIKNNLFEAKKIKVEVDKPIKVTLSPPSINIAPEKPSEGVSDEYGGGYGGDYGGDYEGDYGVDYEGDGGEDY